MPLTLLSKNIALLESKDPDLAEKLRGTRPSSDYTILTSKSGVPTLTWITPGGVRKNLHSSYNPAQEAARFLDSCHLNESLNFIVGGVGLGYHLLELVKRVPRQSRIVILEKDPGLLLLAFEQNDFAELLNHPGVSIHVAIDAAGLEKALTADKTGFALNGYVSISFKPLVDIDRPYYESLNEVFQNILREARLDIKTQTAFSKLFFRNILENLPSILESPGIRTLKETLPRIPAIIISAGPSLDKNINLLKSFMGHAVLISVATALKPLLACGIVPDFVVVIDPDDTSIRAFDLNSPPEKTWLLYDPCIPAVIVENFKRRRLVFDSAIYLAQWIARHNEEKGSLGKTLSVAHTGFLFGKHLGCDPIILVGQDLAFVRNRMHCCDSFFEQDLRDKITQNMVMTDLEKQNHEKYAESLVPVTDIFGNTTTTTLALDSYKNIFAEEIKTSKAVYNATEGGTSISGAENLCLKEALALYCKQDLQTRKKDFLKKIKITGNAENLLSALQEKSTALKYLHRQLADLKGKYLSPPDSKKPDRKYFISEMESLYQTLLKDDEAIRLLQGYSYADFLEWNQENQNLFIKGDGESEIEKRKYERDRKFLVALLKATDSLGQAFEETKEKLEGC